MIFKTWLNLNRSAVEHDLQEVAESEQQRGAVFRE
jgi:hypothetical protein